MPQQLSIDVDTHQAVSILEGANGFIRGEITKRFRALGRRIRDDIRSDIPRRTGRASRAVYSKLDRKRRQNNVTIIVAANLAKAPYLATLESGALIRPKTVSKLAIPVGAAATSGGTARFSAAAVKANPGSFGFRTTFVSKDVVLGERAGGAIEPLFVLKPSVLITKRQYFRRALRRWQSRIITEGRLAVREGLKVSIQRARGGG